MNAGQPTTQNVKRRADRRVISRSAAFAAALWMLLTATAFAPAEEPGMQRLFDGVRRGTSTPEVLHGPQKIGASRSQNQPQHPASQRGAQLQQPGDWPS